MSVAGLVSLVSPPPQHNRHANVSGFYWSVLRWLCGLVLSYILGVSTLL